MANRSLQAKHERHLTQKREAGRAEYTKAPFVKGLKGRVSVALMQIAYLEALRNGTTTVNRNNEYQQRALVPTGKGGIRPQKGTRGNGHRIPGGHVAACQSYDVRLIKRG